jgi:hypothetical protein
MFDATRSARLLVWSLAAFHTGFFLAVLITLLHVSGRLNDFLRSLNTLTGLTMFGVLWLTTWWCTRHAWQDMKWTLNQPLDYGRLYALGIRWGGVNGMLFWLALLTVQTIASIIAAVVSPQLSGMVLTAMSGFFLLGICGAPFSFITGAVFGFIFAVVDGLLIEQVFP